MKRALIVVFLLVGVLATGTAFFFLRRTEAPPPTASATAPSTPEVTAKPEAPAPEDPLLAEIECLLSQPPRCPVKGRAVALGAEGTRSILQTLATQVSGCRAGKSADCVLVGNAYEEGTVVEALPEKAALLYEKACDQGEGDGCQALRALYRQAKGVPHDEARAKALLPKALAAWRKGCTEGRNADCESLMVRPSVDDATEEDKANARASREKSCEQGDKDACTSIALGTGLSESERKDGNRSVALYERACDESHLLACNLLAIPLHYGSNGVKKDEARARQIRLRVRSWLQPKCEAGDLDSCDGLGRNLLEGTPEEVVRGEEYLRKSCDAGTGFACTTLAERALEKEDPASAVEGLRLHERGCTLGDTTSCQAVATTYEKGTGVPADAERALEAYAHLCWLNDATGCWEEARLVGAKVASPETSERLELALLRARAHYEEMCEPAWPVECKRAGDLYDGREGLDADLPRREALYTVSMSALGSDCEAYSEQACLELADLYERGLGGLTRDEDKVRELRDKACVHSGECAESPEEESPTANDEQSHDAEDFNNEQPEHTDEDHEASETPADSE